MSKIKKIIFTLIFSTLFALPLKSEIINKIIINGNKRVSNETIKVYGEIEIKKDISENDLNKILNNLYSTNFFEDVKVNILNNVLTVNVKEYPVVNQLIIIGENSTRTQNEIKKNISLKEKRSFIKSQLSKDIEIIKSLYSSIGYNFSEVEAKIRTIDEDNYDLIISIKKGELTKISSISFIGEKKIRDNRLRDIIASEEDKFWKIISRNTKYSQNLVNLDLDV